MTLKLILNLLFVLKLFKTLSNDLKESDFIVELNDGNTQKYLKENDYVLLMFMTEKCPNCQEFAPIYLETARLMKSTPHLNQIKFARIDGQINEETANKFNVKGYPMIKLISLKHGFAVDYLGNTKAESLLKFVEIRINKNTVEILNINQLNELENKKKLMLVLCGKNETFPQIFHQCNYLMMQHDDLEFYHTSNLEIMNNLNCSKDEPGLILLKNYDEKRLKYEENPFNSSNFEDWINIFSLPSLGKLSEEGIEYSLTHQTPSIILLTNDEESEETTILKQLIQSRAKKYRVTLISELRGKPFLCIQEIIVKLLENYLNTII